VTLLSLRRREDLRRSFSSPATLREDRPSLDILLLLLWLRERLLDLLPSLLERGSESSLRLGMLLFTEVGATDEPMNAASMDITHHRLLMRISNLAA
jgi:hypothetical protein